MFAGALLFCVFGRVNEYATGPAIVRMAGHAELTARAPGTVEEVMVVPGERVEGGQLLVRFYAGVEERERDRAREEFELQLLRVLRDPLDEEARADAAAVRPQLVLAQARLDERNVLAPHAGVVSDIRIRPGQLLATGDPVLTLVQENRDLDLLAFVPGRHRPLLEPGMPMRLEVTGYSHAYLDLEVLEVGDEVVGPSAIRRFLGNDVGDAVPVAGPVVVLHAALPQRTFRADGRDHEFFAGMQGVAAVRVRRESVAVAVVPGLRGFLERFRN
jgi:membrane fusion protein (multidrug efflux system)